MKYSVGKFNFCQLDKIFTESLNKCFMALFLIIVQLLKVAQFQKMSSKTLLQKLFKLHILYC